VTKQLRFDQCEGILALHHWVTQAGSRLFSGLPQIKLVSRRLQLGQSGGGHGWRFAIASGTRHSPRI